MSTVRRKAIAVVCYLVALGGAGAFGVRIFGHGIGWLAEEPRFPHPWPWVIDVGWLLVFGLQHSGMARRSAKRVWEPWLPIGLERSAYAALSGLLLLGLAGAWQPIGGEVWWDLPRIFVVVPLLAAAGMACINARFDHPGLFGLRQAFAGPGEPDEPLLVEGPYRYVRHPLMATLLLVLWMQPHMSPTLALLSGGLTTYVLIGVVFEERDLTRRFAPAYAEYRQRVPALFPWRHPVASRRCSPGERFDREATPLPARQKESVHT